MAIAEGKLDRLPALAAELCVSRLMLSSRAGPVNRAAKEATATIPIVMTQDGDPVGNGFVASLARPGGNITGLSTLSPELSGKRLELLKEVFLSFPASLFSGIQRAGQREMLREIELAARVFGVKLQSLDVLESEGY